jgi:hypothetical protein
LFRADSDALSTAAPAFNLFGAAKPGEKKEDVTGSSPSLLTSVEPQNLPLSLIALKDGEKKENSSKLKLFLISHILI